MPTPPTDHVFGDLLHQMLKARDRSYYQLFGTVLNVALGTNCVWNLTSLHTAISYDTNGVYYDLEGTLHGELPHPDKLKETGFIKQAKFDLVYNTEFYLELSKRTPRSFQDDWVNFRLTLVEHPALTAIIKELWDALEFREAVATQT